MFRRSVVVVSVWKDNETRKAHWFYKYDGLCDAWSGLDRLVSNFYLITHES